MTAMSLNDRIAIVTGAGSGIGLATAVLFGQNGSAVVLVHHNQEDETREAIEEITNAGGRAAAVNADVRNEDDVARVFQVTQKAFGTPNLLVNSAGIDAAGINVADMTMDHFENVLRTNLVGPFLFCRAFAQGLQKAAARGKIINISSVHEELPRAGAADYCASKGGLRNLTRCIALELAPHGITANNIAPGMVLTPMNQKAIDDPEFLKQQVSSIPLKRAAKPEEVASLALFLASSAADYATGSTFTLDGGLELEVGQGA